MKIVVCVNTTTGGAVNDEDAAIRAGSTPISALRDADTHAVEQALRIAERAAAGDAAATVEIVVVSMAPTEALGAVRQALALGASRGVLLDDASVRHLDLAALAAVLAALLASEPADLYLSCSWSGDIDGLLLWTAAGERLGLPVLTQAASFEMHDGVVRISRQSERGDQVLTAPTPCLVEITTTINQARYPTLKGRAAAQNKPISLIRPATLDLDLDLFTRHTTILGTREPARARTATVIHDAASAPEQILAFLRDRRLV